MARMQASMMRNSRPNWTSPLRWLCALAVCLSSGCAAFHSVRGIPVAAVPEEYLGTTRDHQRTIDLSLLRRARQPAYLLDRGDVLGVYVEGELGRIGDPPPVSLPLPADGPPSFGFPMPIRDDGTISLPVAGTIPVRGLTVAQAEQAVLRAYLTPRRLLNPETARVLVSLNRPRMHNVLVIRQEAGNELAASSGQGTLNLGMLKRGTGRVVSLPAYQNDVLHALAQTGGLPGLDAENAIYVIRGRHDDFPPGQSAPTQLTLPLGQNERRRSPNTIIRAQSAQRPMESDSFADTAWPVARRPVAPVGTTRRAAYGSADSDEADYSLLPRAAYGSAEPASMVPGHAPRPAYAGGQDFATAPQPRTAQVDSPVSQAGYASHAAQVPFAQPVTQARFENPAMQARFETPAMQAQWSQPPAGLSPQNLLPTPHPLPGPNLMPLQPGYAPQAYNSVPAPQGYAPYPAPQGYAPMPGQGWSGAPTEALIPGGDLSGGDLAVADWPGLPDGNLDSRHVVRIPVRLSPGETVDIREEDIILSDGDIVFIESRETEVYYTGGLLGGGQYTLPRDYDLDVLGAIAVAQGSQSGAGVGGAASSGGTSALNQDVTTSASRIVILRRTPEGGQIPIEVDLYAALKDPNERVIIQPGDYILLRYKPIEAIGAFVERRLLEGALFGIAAAQLTQGN